MKIKFLGATGTVTGSKFQVQHNGTKILVDCGLFQGPKELRELNRIPLQDNHYDAVVLSHAHIDHSGYLPCLVKNGFRNKIHSTHATFDLCKIMLLDAAKLQEEDADFANKTKHSKHIPAEPLYQQVDALKSLELFVGHAYNQWIQLSPFMSFRFIRNGHILGSASVQIQYTENDTSKILTFTGDLGGGRSQVIKDPEFVLETDYLVTESTYGDRKIKELVEEELSQLINRVYRRQGTLVIPAFSVGRTQELLFIIKKLQEEKLIPSQMPIYLDSPMATKASGVYAKYGDELKLTTDSPLAETFFQPENFRITETSDESMLLCMSTATKIVISASGMLQGGRVMHHLRAKLPDPKNAVLFTGYQGKGTKGLLLKTGINKIRIHHQEVEVEAEIIALDSLSAHADSEELMKWYKNLRRPPLTTFLVHGEESALGALQYRISTELGWKAVIPKSGEEFTL